MKWFGKITKHPNFVTVAQIAEQLNVEPSVIVEYGMVVGVQLDNGNTLVEPVLARTLYMSFKKETK